MNSQLSSRARVLIVDDKATAREMLGALLSVTKAYELLYATSGHETVERLDELNPDVILLDVMMPGLNGFEVCQKIKATTRWQHIPIILVTALDSRKDLARGLEAGADDFLHKPVNGIELRARVNSMLRIKKQFDALQATLQLREDMAHMIVHDMRTPLTAILGVLELLEGGYITCDDPEIDKLYDQAVRLNAFVNDILVQAKMEHGKLRLNWGQVDVKALIQTVKKDHQLFASNRDIDLIVNLPAEDVQTRLDANLFQRVLDNLVSNALKFSPPKTVVTIQLEDAKQTDYNLRIKVFDQGPGISAENKERIFNKYEIANLKRSGDSAVGLGLAFAKLVVEAHGGRIFVEPNEPVGSVFVVEF